MNDIALPALIRHLPPSGATHQKCANAQSQDLTSLSNAAIAANQTISVSGMRLEPGFPRIGILVVRKNAGDDSRSKRDEILLPQKSGHC